MGRVAAEAETGLTGGPPPGRTTDQTCNLHVGPAPRDAGKELSATHHTNTDTTNQTNRHLAALDAGDSPRL
jgi:hypothetical protein